jgi:hypothetical protein
MKKLLLTLGFCLGLTPGPFAQTPGQQSGTFSDRLQEATHAAGRKPDDSPKFNLDFPGGGPKALVAAIEKASGKPLNAIVPTQYETVQLPPMKLTGVTAPAVFQALAMATSKPSPPSPGPGGGFYVNPNTTVSDSFETRGEGENAVWYFHAHPSQEPPRYCRFYQLADFLDTYKIEDITTAIKTGWQLVGVKFPPELKFHPETKLLIAVGTTDEMQTIESVLEELRKGTAPRPPGTQSGVVGMRPPRPPQAQSAAVPVRPEPASPAKNDGASNKP